MGVQPARITKWTAEGMPVADRGSRGRESRYDLREVVEWYVRRQLEARGLGSGQELDLPTERAKQTRAQTARIMLDIKAKQRELLPADEVRRVVGGALHAVRVRFLGLGQSIAERCRAAADEGAPTVQAVIDEAVHDALTELAQAKSMDGSAAPDPA